MDASMQLPLPPTLLRRVGDGRQRSAKKVGIDLVSALLRAGGRIGMSDKEMAAVFGLSASDFAKAFGKDYPDRNRPMKAPLTPELERELANVLIEEAGLREEAQNALLESLARYAVVNQR